MVILLGTGPCAMLGCISVDMSFSSSFSSFFFVICGFRPLSKLRVQAIALAMVSTIRITVITAKVVSDRLAARYAACREGWYMRTSLKRKYASAAK